MLKELLKSWVYWLSIYQYSAYLETHAIVHFKQSNKRCDWNYKSVVYNPRLTPAELRRNLFFLCALHWRVESNALRICLNTGSSNLQFISLFKGRQGRKFENPGAPLTYFNDRGVRRIFLGLTFWPKGIFLGLWKTPGFFWVAKTTEGFFWVLYFSSAQIKNNKSAIYSFVFDQDQSWSWHVLAFQKINNKICWYKNTEGFYWVC